MEQKMIAAAHFKNWLLENKMIPVYLEVVNQFIRNELNYYVIEYMVAGSELLLGVAGGYEEGAVEHCGHVHSKMELFMEGNEIEQAEALVDEIEGFWSQHAAVVEQKFRKNAEEGRFVGHLLLASHEWDADSLCLELAERWNIKVDAEASNHILSFEVDDMSVEISLHEGQLDHHEAQIHAASNIDWPEVLDIVNYHQAYLTVMVKTGSSPLEAGKLHVKVMSCLSMQDNVLAVDAAGTIFEPGLYDEYSDLMKDGSLPIYNMIHFGFYRTSNGLSGYTYGLKMFGELEIEVLDTFGETENLHEFLSTLVYSVLMKQIELKHGNKISLSEGHELMVVEGMSEALNERTVKVEYPN